MKKILVLFFVYFIFANVVFADLSNVNFMTFSYNNRFGLKDENGNVTISPKYQKLIRLGDSSWIVQKKSKYGIVDSYGNILVKPLYPHADRLMGKYVKLGKDFKYGIFDEKGEIFIPVEYDSIDMLFGGMFLTCKNFKYGIIDKNGNIILDNKFDEIYMPKPNVLCIRHNGKLYEITQTTGGELSLPQDLMSLADDNDFDINTFVSNPVAASGYSAVTITDYILKIVSSISPAHEATIDELVLSQGADTVSVLMRFSWIPKYPYTYIRNYYYNFMSPNAGPLNEVKNSLKEKMAE